MFDCFAFHMNLGIKFKPSHVLTSLILILNLN